MTGEDLAATSEVLSCMKMAEQMRLVSWHFSFLDNNSLFHCFAKIIYFPFYFTHVLANELIICYVRSLVECNENGWGERRQVNEEKLFARSHNEFVLFQDPNCASVVNSNSCSSMWNPRRCRLFFYSLSQPLILAESQGSNMWLVGLELSTEEHREELKKG